MGRENSDTDVLLVGAGPVGLYGAYCSGFRGLRTMLVDGEKQVGGQISMLYPEKSVRDVAGVPEASGRELVARLHEQAMTYSPTVLLGQHVRQVDTADPDHLTVELSGSGPVRCRAVVLTAGIGSFTPRRLPAETTWSGEGIHYTVADPGAFRGRRVLVAGGGDSAVDWAHELAGIAGSVTLVHRRRTFRAHAANVAQLAGSGVDVRTECEVAELLGDGRVEAVRLTAPSGEEIVPADDVVVALGFLSELGPLASWGLELRGRAVAVDQQMRTSVPRIYAAGDLADYPGKVRLIAVGFGEVATAVGNAACAAGMAESLFPGHSTDLPAMEGRVRS
ncbi:NAD(P)/FAD-dependent oxidoreductase [Amycolatopsis jejuensis]|uniref:NAD(P)/FAD-dependent oxidoreductase n=1 Tax=Amycolatopsis jejuensis TaxID=330084 RepID=UPI000526FE46|nr:NAD(P)/FAD-dependent oxidoreductase [Amycolatopsis jejuensis]